ncbi:MAG: hypothetical protein BGO70_09565 [Bacteroidetes bacterium 43-93]|nr:hypothetical protein [Bacteroidota bacterium]OJX00407.1 MAG: hypothetical protein BGO70_09565 [Bacteroidetes bacterium 43-93]
MDVSKLDKAYFVGEYEVNYENEKEKLILKDNNYYDYIYVPNKDTIINAGEWSFLKDDWVTVTLKNYPLKLRREKVFTEDSNETANLMLSVNTNLDNEMGDLIIGVNGGEGEYAFVKLNKDKNKNYMKN